MRRFRTNMVAVALATLLLVAVSSAQQTSTTAVPNLIRYSGTLKDAQGAVPSGTPLGVTFAIYKQQDGGVPVWQEIQNVTPDASGQYSVVLGSTTATGLPDDLFLQQEQRWLGVQVQGEAEQARVLLVSVPYAFKAHEAETLGGLPPSSFVKVPLQNANGIGSNAGSGAVGENVTTVMTPQSSESTVAQGGAWARAGTTVKLSTGTDKVGIGTSTPNAKLDVAGNVHASGSISSGNATVTLDGNENAITVDSVPPTLPGKASQLYLGGENAAGTIPFSTIQVGLATKAISSDSKLSIFDPLLPSLDVVTKVPGNARGQLAVAHSAGYYSLISVPGDVVLRADADPNIGFTATKSLILAARNNNGGAIRFVTGLNLPLETEKMTLLSGGNFGIANNQPQQLFAVGRAFNALNTSPFEVNSGGDIVTIKRLAYSWPTAYGTAPGFVLTDTSGRGTLAWLKSTSSGGNVVGPSPVCAANFLTKWTGGLNVGCTHDYEAPSNFFLGVNVGAAPAAALDVNGQSTSGINTTDTRQSYMIGLRPVLSIFPFASGNLFVGANTGSGGTSNTFVGEFAGLASGSGSSQNAFFGSSAGRNNTTGTGNTFLGYLAGNMNTMGGGNTFVGFKAGLNSVDTSTANCCNTFVGDGAGAGVNGATAATGNSFFGHRAGEAIETGGDKNVFSGYWSGLVTTTGVFNAFYGSYSGQNNTTGSANTYLGAKADSGGKAGNNNIHVGFEAGVATLSGGSNIEIGNAGKSADGGYIRIGTEGTGNGQQHDNTYIAGIWNVGPINPAANVCIDSTGHLGTICVISSRRFKEQIADMGDSSSKLFDLRPVTFFYKPEYDDGSHLLQFGLIAEEVAKVYPDMAVYGKDGQPLTVKYQLLAPMLLNELQKQHAVVAAQEEAIKTQQEQIQSLQERNEEFQQRLSRLESLIAKK